MNKSAKVDKMERLRFMYVSLLFLLLCSCSSIKGVYVEKREKKKNEILNDFEYTRFVKMSFYHKDTTRFMQYRFGTVVLNGVPITTDSVGRQLESDLFRGSLKCSS